MDTANSTNLWLYNPDLRKFARQNRKSMTKAEACLWKFVLSKSQMRGYPFRRQRPVLNYIADFMCKELMLIVEVDGATHHQPEVATKDITREAELKKAGFNVLRFTDEEVLSAINNVAYRLEEYVDWFNRQDKEK